MGKIIFHIGPPKTATTSLQIALANISLPNFLFAGTFQPRQSNKGSLSDRIYRLCLKEVDKSSFDYKDIHNKIICELSKDINIFISEEMFLVGDRNSTFFEKMRLLHLIIGSFPCEILVTARKPSAALPSYYQEIFETLPANLQMNFANFCRDEISGCYDYEGLSNFLKKTGFKNVRFVDFDKLCTGGTSLESLTGLNEYADISVNIERHNRGIFEEHVSDRSIPSVFLGDIGRLPALKRLANSLGIKRWSSFRRLVVLLDGIAIRKAGQRKLIVPADVIHRLDAGYHRVLQYSSGNDV